MGHSSKKKQAAQPPAKTNRFQAGVLVAALMLFAFVLLDVTTTHDKVALSCSRNGAGQGECQLAQATLLNGDKRTIPLSDIREVAVRRAAGYTPNYDLLFITPKEDIKIQANMGVEEALAIGNRLKDFVAGAGEPRLDYAYARPWPRHFLNGLLIAFGLFLVWRGLRPAAPPAPAQRTLSAR